VSYFVSSFTFFYFVEFCGRQTIYLCVLILVAVWSKALGLRPLACWDRGFESCQEHGCLSVVSVVLSGRGLCDGLITHSEES
jgi:hypothetical protein